jgi:chaperonin GroES
MALLASGKVVAIGPGFRPTPPIGTFRSKLETNPHFGKEGAERRVACTPPTRVRQFPACDGSNQVRPPMAISSEGKAPMKIVPLGDKVVVKRLDAEERTAGGIVLPDAAKEKPQQGKVLSVGEGRLLESGKHIPLDVHEGDRVVFTAWAGTPVKVDGDELLIMNESEILAILK